MEKKKRWGKISVLNGKPSQDMVLRLKNLEGEKGKNLSTKKNEHITAGASPMETTSACKK